MNRKATARLAAVTAILSASLIAPSFRSPESAQEPAAFANMSSADTAFVPASFVSDDLDIRSAAVDIPLRLRLPTLNVNADIIGVGITPGDVMDTPIGTAEDAAKNTYWYRGSAIPGELSTALIAGHLNGPGGRTGIFADLHKLEQGDPVNVQDARDGREVQFTVTDTEKISLEDASELDVLKRIYGAGPVNGNPPERSADGLAHLVLITCTGTFKNGTHDHRLVVHAVRTS